MSSSNEESTDLSLQKKRKIQRACDNCKRRKRRCDGGENCSNCIDQGVECTYNQQQKKRGRQVGFVEKLESRLQLLERIVKKFVPDASTLHGLVYPHDPEYAETLTKISTPPSSSSNSSPPSDTKHVPSVVEAAPSTAIATLLHKLVTLSLGDPEDPFLPPANEDRCTVLLEQMKSLSVDPKDQRYWGESSGVLLLQDAITEKMKDANANDSENHAQAPWLIKRHLLYKKLPLDDYPRCAKQAFSFPPTDLITKLTDSYFEHVNLLYPLLHRPTFERSIAEGLHFRDSDGFGSVLLLVCAVGSRYLEPIDERTLNDGDSDPFMAGWKWYRQVQVVKPNLVEPPTLYDLQIYCLAVEYLVGSCGPQTVWLLTGFGIRVAQDVGAHRKLVAQDKLTVEDELWKRAFWVLIAKDRMISLALGRPCAIFDNHFDLDLPVECDDKYWENDDPKLRFKQPAGVPSTVTAFIRHLQLTKIMSFSMNTVFSVRSNIWEVISEGWEHLIVSELDSALNNWLHALPEHLRWDPSRVQSDTNFKLSSSLVTFYYYVQILIHRPYIRSTHNHKLQSPSGLAFPSLAICNSAARSTALVLHEMQKRINTVYPHMQLYCTSAMIVLVINGMGNKRRKGVNQREGKYVKMCMDVLKKAEGMSYCASPVMKIFGDYIPGADPETVAAVRESVPSSFETSQIFTPSGSEVHIRNDINNDFLSYMPDTLTGLFDHESNSLVSGHNHHSVQGNIYSATGEPTHFPEANIFNMPGEYNVANFSASRAPIINHNPSPLQNPFENTYTTADGDQLIDNNTMAMWFNAPTGFAINEWQSFLSNFPDLSDEFSSEMPSRI